MKITVPGKIFIGGEYAALRGLPALTVAVKPEFVWTDSSSTADKGHEKFHQDSPAGLMNSQLLGHFFDPYKNVGGLGRSTAEFIAAAISLNSSFKSQKNKWDLWKLYRRTLAGSQVPSGVDLLTQVTGGYCLSETRSEKIEKMIWPFQELDWVAVITGNKVKTHEHLSKPLQLDWAKLEIANQRVVEAFVQAKPEDFISNLNIWRQFLFESGLEVAASTELIEFFKNFPGVQAAKGCGALGSDVIFILFEKKNSQDLEKALQYWDSQHLIRSSQVCVDGLQTWDENENLRAL